MAENIYAPWTDEQVANLQRWQDSEMVHSYTCGACGYDLVPQNDGWICPVPRCQWRQTWAMDFDTTDLPMTYDEFYRRNSG